MSATFHRVVSRQRLVAKFYKSYRSLSTAKQSEANLDKVEAIKQAQHEGVKTEAEAASAQTTKTVAQIDEEMRRRMSALAGDGGEAGVEYEDGRPADMKRAVRNNMFRYI